MRVGTAADRMNSFNADSRLIAKEFWRKKLQEGKLTKEQYDRLHELSVSEREIIGRGAADRKIQYFAAPDGSANFAVGFSGYSGVQKTFVKMDKSNVRTMQDLADAVDQSYKLENVRGSKKYLATDGREIYELEVGRENKQKATATQLEGRLHLDAFGEEKMHNRLSHIYDLRKPAERTREEVEANLRQAFAEQSRYLVNPNDKKRPVNSVSASFDGYSMGPYPQQMEQIGFENQNELEIVQNLRAIRKPTIVEDLIREGGWDPDLNNHADLNGLYESAIAKLNAEGWRNPYAEAGASGSSGAGGGAGGSGGRLYKKRKDAYSSFGGGGRYGKPPPTPTKEIGGNLLKKNRGKGGVKKGIKRLLQTGSKHKTLPSLTARRRGSSKIKLSIGGRGMRRRRG